MATIGQILSVPETDMSRYDDTNSSISHIGTWDYIGSSSYTYSSSCYQRFNFTGSKIIFLDAADSWSATSHNIYIDGIKYVSPAIIVDGAMRVALIVDNLADAEHFVSISTETANASHHGGIPRIDIPSTSILKPYNTNVSLRKYLVKTIDEHYHSYKTGSWIDLGIPLDSSALTALFKNEGGNDCPSSSSIALLGSKAELCFWTDDAKRLSALMKSVAVPYAKLVLSGGDIPLTSIQYINSATLTSVHAKVIVSTNGGLTWQTWNGSAWALIDVSNLNNISTSGMTKETVSGLVRQNWVDLIGSSKTLRFGYLLDILASTDLSNADAITLNVDMRGEWRTQCPTIGYDSSFTSTSSIKVSIYTSGDYKINY